MRRGKLPFSATFIGWLPGLIVAALPALALAAPEKTRHAAMVIDANTGKVLHEVYADAPRHPASLTKMMTIYLALEQIEQKRLTFSSKLTMSERAASVAPSKLGLEPGEEIELLDAIKILITKSANDVAVALAERIGGSEVGFVRLMNDRARQIGMRATLFTNASGLPDPRQITTARDMLTLALRLQDDFPEHFRLFSIKSFQYGGKVYRTHNTLLHGFPGMDGIKTGYTRASGFNLVSSVRTGKKHLVAAVLGGATASARNAHMRLILFRALEKASTQVTRRPDARVVASSASEDSSARLPPIIQQREKVATAAGDTKKPLTPPRPKPVAKNPAPKPDAIAAALKAAEASDAAVAGAAPAAETPPATAATVTKLDLAALREAMSSEQSQSAEGAAAKPASIEDIIGAPAAAAAQPQTGDQIARLAREDSAGDADPAPPQTVNAAADSARPPSTLDAQAHGVAPTPAPVREFAMASAPGPSFAPPMRLAAAPVGTGYEIQIGAYSTAAEAQSRLTGAVERSGGLLDGHAPLTMPVKKGEHQIFRARFTRFDEADASKTCQALLKLSIDCFVMRAE